MTSEALRRVVVEYIQAVMQKRITFKNADERREGAERMIKEADQFKFLFRKLAAVSSFTSLLQGSLWRRGSRRGVGGPRSRRGGAVGGVLEEGRRHRMGGGGGL